MKLQADTHCTRGTDIDLMTRSSSMVPTSFAAIGLIEPLESRIAPAAVIPDVIAGAGKTGTTIHLAEFYDDDFESPGRTLVKFSTNLDVDLDIPGIQPGPDIIVELFDDLVPLTVQNFLTYVLNRSARGDYDGTFIHRTADFGAGSGAGTDIVQGGGFQVSDPRAHIPTGFEVHNEYNPALPNVRGTIAMAKTGLSPNTATSEWFFNLNDNSSILDERNNGGFTVFGRVIQGIEVIDRIGSLPTFDFDGAISSLPLQNYQSDPDSNPTTPPPEVKKENFVTIDEARVLPRAEVANAGLTFSVTVTDPNGQPTDLVATKLSGTDLELTYKRGESGTATIHVQPVQNGSLLEPQDFQVVLLPNLIANISVDPFAGVIVGGDVGKAKIRVGNNGSALVQTNVNVSVYLSKLGPDDPNGTLINATDLLVGQILNKPVSLAGGKSVTVSAEINVPQTLITDAGETYRVIAAIEPIGVAIAQLFTDDDSAIDGRVHKWENLFGTFEDQSFGGRKHVSLSYTEQDGDVVTFSMKGAGGGRLLVNDDVVDLVIDETNGFSVVRAAVDGIGEPRLQLNQVHVAETIGSVQLPNANVAGSVALSGGAKRISLGDLGGEIDSTLLIGSFGQPNEQRTIISLGHVRNVSLESLMPIRSLSVLDWRDSAGGNDSIAVGALGRLNVTAGDFEADVTLSGNAKLVSFAVECFFRNATLRTDGDVGQVRIGGMDHAQFLVAVGSRPNMVGDFVANRSIQNFTIGGDSAESRLLITSHIAAPRFGSVSVDGVQPDGGGEQFGFVADAIKRYNRNGTALRDLEAPGLFDVDGDYAVVLL